MNKVDLTQLNAGNEARIIEIAGGHLMSKRVEALGIRVGVKIKKLSTQVWRGPVTIQIGNSQIAIGFGMAKKIYVNPN
jgi:ferrous iron transport protein A